MSQIVWGRPLKLQWAQHRGAGGAEAQSFDVFVGDLAKEVDEQVGRQRRCRSNWACSGQCIAQRVLEEAGVGSGLPPPSQTALTAQPSSCTGAASMSNSDVNRAKDDKHFPSCMLPGPGHFVPLPQKLREAFSHMGTVTRVVVMWDYPSGRNKGYGFVSFATQEVLAARVWLGGVLWQLSLVCQLCECSVADGLVGLAGAQSARVHASFE